MKWSALQRFRKWIRIDDSWKLQPLVKGGWKMFDLLFGSTLYKGRGFDRNPIYTTHIYIYIYYTHIYILYLNMFNEYTNAIYIYKFTEGCHLGN